MAQAGNRKRFPAFFLSQTQDGDFCCKSSQNMVSFRWTTKYNMATNQLVFRGDRMIKDLMYIELKTGYSDDGPAWIGYVKTSKTKKTIYFNDHAFQKYNGVYSNYVDIENGEEYWISGLKKKESNRHWAGHGKIMIDRRAVEEYLALIGEKELPLNLFQIVDIEDRFPVERANKRLNDKE